MEQIANDLRNAGVEKVYTDHVLAGYTTWKIGGKADLFVVPNKEEELVQTVQILNRSGIPWMHARQGVQRAHLGQRVPWSGHQAWPCVRKGSLRRGGRLCGRRLFVYQAVGHGRQRRIDRTGICGRHSGTVGGAVYMNAGAHGSDVSRILKSCRYRSGNRRKGLMVE